MKRHIQKGANAGKKWDGRDKSKKPYSLYDTCEICTVRTYIKLICNDDLQALVISGSPSDEVLQDAKMRLIAEFSERCDNETSSKVNETLRKIYLYQSQIMGLQIAMFSLVKGGFEKAIEYLNESGIRVKLSPGDSEGLIRLLKKLEGIIKNKNIKLREKVKAYNELATKTGGKKPTEQDYYEQIAALSKNAGVRLTIDITLAEYAAYMKDCRETIKALERNAKS